MKPAVDVIGAAKWEHCWFLRRRLCGVVVMVIVVRAADTTTMGGESEVRLLVANWRAY